MAGPYNPPKKGKAFVVHIALQDLSNPGSFKANPTIASGDFKVDVDGAGLGNLGTLPTNDPAGSIWVKLSLSTDEMNGDNINIQAIDQTSPKEWADFALCVETAAA